MIKICPDCNINTLKSGVAKRCVPCGNIHVKKQRKMYYEKSKEIKTCQNCSKKYKTRYLRQIYCLNPCKSKEIN